MNANRAKIISIVIFATFLIFSLCGCGTSGSSGSGENESPSVIGSVSAQASPENIIANGTDTSLVTATVYDDNGKPMGGETVSFYKTDDGLPVNDTYKGSGTKVTSMFYGSGSVTFTLTHTGQSNFIVHLWSEEGGSIAILANEIGEVDTYETIKSLDAGNYFFEVRADGNWDIAMDGNVAQFTGERLSTKKTDSSGKAMYTYTGTFVKGDFGIKAEAGDFSDTAKIVQQGGIPAMLEIDVARSEIYANGESTSTIIATVRDAHDNLVGDGIIVAFDASDGAIDATADTLNGVASLELRSSLSTGTATVSAHIKDSPDISADIDVDFSAVFMTDMKADPPIITADGEDTSTITIRLKDAKGIAVEGETVNFSTTGGTLSAGFAQTDASGVATVEIIAPLNNGLATVTASYGLITRTVGITFDESENPDVGSISLTANPMQLTADGTSSTTVTAAIKDSAGAAMPSGTAIRFTTTLGHFSNGSRSITIKTINDSGTIVTSLVTGAEPGTATLIASSSGISQALNIIFLDSSGSVEVEYLSLSLSQPTVKSDNSDQSEITAIALDSNRVPVEGARIIFSTSGGQISNAYPITDTNGEAVIFFSSGTVDKSNQTATIEASVSGVDPKQVPIQIVGTTLTLDPGGNTNLEIGGTNTSTLTITARDAGNNNIPGATVNFSQNPNNIVNISPASGVTDINGEMEVEITGVAEGDVSVIVNALGTTATQSYSVGAIGEVFGITDPATAIVGLNTNEPLTITVSAPSVLEVGFATSVGFFGPAPGEQYVDVVVAGDTASATFTSATAGVATIQVFDKADLNTFDTLTVSISAPSDEASQISLQVTPSNVGPSTGSVQNIADLLATVKNNTDQVVGGATVAFSIVNPTGGGESISPVLINTDSSGSARSVFTSGSLPSGGEGVNIIARVLGAAFTGPNSDIAFSSAGTITRSDAGGSFIADGFVIGDEILVSYSKHNDGSFTITNVAANTLTVDPQPIDLLPSEAEGATVVIGTIVDIANIVIGGTAGSVVIGRSTQIQSDDTNTHYILPMSVLVTDAGGHPMSGAIVSLGSWPESYNTGYWNEDDEPVITGTYLNEDVNRNNILDPDEDDDGDGIITPLNSSSGSVPQTVTTDASGVANFELVYLKQYAVWINAEIKASTIVAGTETVSKLVFTLPYAEDDAPHLPDSPFD